jgi:glycine/D-amino acid oxidase-like deaminating enzyme
VSDGVFQRSDTLLERTAMGAESSGRNWGEIGIGLAAALALVRLYLAAMWALLVAVEALL